MTNRVGLLMLGIGMTLTACQKNSTTADAVGSHTAPRQIAWREGDVDDAFAEAKEANKPVLLYWGAKWCPPCNQMKQTLFKDPDFIAETANFVPVYLDGDAKGAQLWGERFGISGYPTVIILRPDRTEVTRLAGGSTASALAGVLKVAATRTTSTEDLLARADRPATLSPDDWRLLASFDWFDDPKHFGDTTKGAAFVGRLADAAPDPAIRRQFALTSLAMQTGDTGGEDKPTLTADQQAEVRRILPAILADPAEVRANRQELSYFAPELIVALPDAAERQALGRRLVAALDTVAADPKVPLGDRLLTVHADTTLSKAAHGGKVSPDVLAKVRRRVAAANRAATDPMTRQAVVSSAGELLADAGDSAGAMTLWKAELPHAIAPYYYMADLAGAEEQAGNKQAAIDWLRQGAETAQGPATRIQWAMMYSQGVMRMTPDDKPAVERSAGMVVDALGHNGAGYAQRTEKKAQAWAKAMQDWSGKHDGAAVLADLDRQMDRACTQGACRNVLKG